MQRSLPGHSSYEQPPRVPLGGLRIESARARIAGLVSVHMYRLAGSCNGSQALPMRWVVECVPPLKRLAVKVKVRRNVGSDGEASPPIAVGRRHSG